MNVRAANLGLPGGTAGRPIAPSLPASAPLDDRSAV